MRLSFKCEMTEDGNVDACVYDAATGEQLEMVQAVSFTMDAEAMVPQFAVSVIPENVELVNVEADVIPAALAGYQAEQPNKEE